MRWLATLTLVLIFVGVSSAQIQGNRPEIIDATQDTCCGNTSGSITWPENVSSGDTIICGLNTQNDGSTFSIADSTGAPTWTTTATITSPVVTNANAWMAYKSFSGSATVTITLTRTSGTGYFYINCDRYSGLGAADGSPVTNTASGAGGLSTISTSVTTTANNDILVSATISSNFGGASLAPSNTEGPNYTTIASPAVRLMVSHLHAGLKGATTSTINTYGDSGNVGFAMITQAFKTATNIQIVDSGSLPDAGSGIAYSAQLHCQGGTAAQTYSLNSGALPTGLSLNTSTGAITGSTTATGSYSLGFGCTDGTITSGTRTLSLIVGAALNVPNVRQTITTLNGDNGGGSVTASLECGSTIVLFRRGGDTHSTQPFVTGISGTNNYVKMNPVATVFRMAPIPGNSSWPLEADIFPAIPASGTYVISIAASGSISVGRPINLILELTGGNVWDYASSLSTTTNTATGSFSNSYTTLVPNTLLISANDTNGAASMSIASPFTPFSTPLDVAGVTLYAQTIAATASTVNSVVSFSGSSTVYEQFDNLIVPVRPALPVSGCPANFGTGEKFRRVSF